MKYVVTEEMTLLEASGKMAPDSSRTTLRSWIKEGRVNVDDVAITDTSCKVLSGQTVSMGAKKKIVGGGIQILFEDQHIVVIEKPSGLLSVATASEKDKTAHQLLKDRYRPRKVYPVHRLDQDTSGVMLFALSEEAMTQLNIMFKTHDLNRCYIGVVEGNLEASSGIWQSYLYEDEQFVVHSSPVPGRGVLAKTHFEVKRVSKKYSLVEFTLETGKKNQIRVHCSEAGHPLAGDKKYGAVSDPAHRLCLHAHVLSFQHPMTGKQMSFESPIPKEFFF